eukprot:jgi/Antlo1/2056/642
MATLKSAVSQILYKLKTTDRLLFLFLLVYRTVNAFLIRTVFEPDEIFQNIEPIPFFFGRRYTPTWDWMLGIRSINFVLLYLVPSSLAYALENMWIAYAAPKVVNGLLSAMTDYFAIKTAALHNVDAFIITLLSHGLWLYSPRSHINSFEMLVGIASFYFLEKFRREISVEKKKMPGSLRMFAYIVLYGSFIRPSACLLTLLPFVKLLMKHRIYRYLKRLVPELLLFLCLLVINDSLYYKEFVLVPFNFIKVNVFSGVSNLFGSQPLFSHVFFAAVLLGITLPVAFRHGRHFPGISASVFLFAVFYSLLSHKEMRFILPIVPFCNIIAAKSTHKFLFVYLISMIFSVYVCLYYQNIGSSISLLQSEIEDLDKRNRHCKDIRIFYCLWPYLMPKYPFLPNRRVYIRDLGENPDIFSKIPKPKIYKRFEKFPLIVNEHSAFIADLSKNILNFVDYDFILMHRSYYEETIDIISRHFDVVKRQQYFPMPLKSHVCAFIYVLKNKRHFAGRRA